MSLFALLTFAALALVSLAVMLVACSEAITGCNECGMPVADPARMDGYGRCRFCNPADSGRHEGARTTSMHIAKGRHLPRDLNAKYGCSEGDR